MTDWFVADPHVGHGRIIALCNRPFASVEEMDRTFVRNWNAVVGPQDQVRILGDLAYRCSVSYAVEIYSQLNGVKRVIAGNHDKIAAAIHRNVPGMFASWDLMDEIELDGQRIILCHYAMREWHHSLRGTWHLFGHTHGALRPFGKSVDVGVDNTGEIVGGAFYRPVSLEEIRDFMDQRPIGPHALWDNFTPELIP